MIESVQTLEEITEPYAGQTVWNESDQAAYRWDPIEGWEIMPEDSTETTSEVGMSIYDINRQIIHQMPGLTSDEIHECIKSVTRVIDESMNRFYMLLCRDINYYTVFMRDSSAEEMIENVVIECAEYIGQIKSIEYRSGAVEIWVSTQDNTYAMYFFPYDGGVEICQ